MQMVLMGFPSLFCVFIGTLNDRIFPFCVMFALSTEDKGSRLVNQHINAIFTERGTRFVDSASENPCR